MVIGVVGKQFLTGSTPLKDPRSPGYRHLNAPKKKANQKSLADLIIRKDPANDIAGSLSVGSEFVIHYATIFQLLGCLTRKESKKLRSPSPFTSVHGESTAFRNDIMFFRPSIDNTTSHLFYIYPVLGK